MAATTRHVILLQHWGEALYQNGPVKARETTPSLPSAAWSAIIMPALRMTDLGLLLGAEDEKLKLWKTAQSSSNLSDSCG